MIVSTADVRPVADVVTDLRKILVRELKGAKTHPGHMAAWSALGTCQENLLSPDESAQFDRRDMDQESVRWRMKRASEHYVAASVVRKIADAYGVPNFRDGVEI